MTPGSPTGVVITASVTDMNQTLYQKDYAAGLLILDTGIEEPDLGKILSAYGSHYTGLFSYRKYPRKKSGKVPITLMLKGQRYQATLNKPQQRKGAWISAGPVYDSKGHDVKLAGALANAGFPVRDWTQQVLPPLATRRARTLAQVKFLVEGTTWELMSSPSPPPPSSGRSPNLKG